MTKIFLIERLTTDETDYTVIGMTPNFNHAVALCSRNNKYSISEWEYDDTLLQYRYKRSYNCKGELVQL